MYWNQLEKEARCAGILIENIVVQLSLSFDNIASSLTLAGSLWRPMVETTANTRRLLPSSPACAVIRMTCSWYTTRWIHELALKTILPVLELGR